MLMLAVQIGMLIWGIVILVNGQISLSRKQVVEGTPARIIGAIAMLPLPLALGSGFLLGLKYAAEGRTSLPRDFQTTVILIEFGTLAACVVLMLILGFLFAENPKEKERQRLQAELDRESPNASWEERPESEDVYDPRRHQTRGDDRYSE